jgi:uncharacterized protein (UPF0332 family)
MSFNWNDFRKVAEDLRGGEEAEKRTAISRIYYSVYHLAKLHLESEDFQFRQFESSHRQIWDEYKDRGRTFAAVGHAGDRLRANRIKADYINQIENVDALVARSFELAENAFSYLSQVEKKSEN